MSEVRPTSDDEIDLFDLVETLWDGKLKIIATTFVAAVIGVALSVVLPNSFDVSTPIQSGEQSVFLKYTSLNDLLRSEELLFDEEKNPSGFIIDSNSIFKKFVIEFNDYKEMVDAVSTSEFAQKSIKYLGEDDKQRKLVDFAKSFELKAPSKNQEDWTLSFEWHDELEGVRLFNDAIRQTLSNLKNVSKASVNDLADAIDVRNTQNLEKLRTKLSVIKQLQIIDSKRHIQYLLEQSAIAKELSIETNSLDANALSQSSQNAISFSLDANALSQSSQNAISLSVNSSDVPFYLRGFKAIDKEILLIKSRSEEEHLLNAADYLEAKEKILSLEKSLSSSQLRKISEVIASENVNDWVEFDLGIADVKSNKKPKLYVALSILFGGMVGVMYVVISNAIRNRKERLAKS